MESISTFISNAIACPVEVRAMPQQPRDITKVSLLEDLSRLEPITQGALLVLTRSTVAAAGSFQLDVFVRHCAQRGAAAVLMRRSTPRSITAESLAVRGGVALLDIDDSVDPLFVVDELSTRVGGDARAALRKLATVARRTHQGASVEEVVAEISLGCEVAMEYLHGESHAGSPVRANGRVIGAVRAASSADFAVIAARLAADSATALIAEQERLLIAPVRTASAALAAILLCSQANLASVSARASEVGLDVDGWHTAARLAVIDNKIASDHVHLEEELVQLLAEHQTRHDSAQWSVARPDQTFVIVRTTPSRPGTQASGRLNQSIRAVVERLGEAHPHLNFHVGLATSHQGAAGLRLCAEESRIALAAAKLTDGPLSICEFQSLGARRMLAEWMITEAGRETVRDVLAPIDALGEQRAATAVATLHAYLDEQGSLQRAAQRLHVHRNAVVYRLERLRAAGIDLDDPDNRFALQLACRARLTTTEA